MAAPYHSVPPTSPPGNLSPLNPAYHNLGVSRTGSASSSRESGSTGSPIHSNTTHGVVTGQIGGGYGPFAYQPGVTHSTDANDFVAPRPGYAESRYSVAS